MFEQNYPIISHSVWLATTRTPLADGMPMMEYGPLLQANLHPLSGTKNNTISHCKDTFCKSTPIATPDCILWNVAFQWQNLSQLFDRLNLDKKEVLLFDD